MSKPGLINEKGAAVAAEAVAVPAPRALTFGGFQLTSYGLKVTGRPNFADFGNALHTAVYLEGISPFWKADLLEYGHSRHDWKDLLDNVIDSGTFTKKTVDRYRQISRSVPKDRRVEGVSFSHHAEVVVLEPLEQTKFLEAAKAEHLSVAELREAVKKHRKKTVRRILAGQSVELADLHHTLASAAHRAGEWCKQIPLKDAKDAEDHIRAARLALGECSEAVENLRKAQGVKP